MSSTPATSKDDITALVAKRSELVLDIARHRVRAQRLGERSVLAEAGLGSARLALSLLVNRARTAGFMLDEDEVMERAVLIEEQAREQSGALVSAREEIERSWVREQEMTQDLQLLDDEIALLRARRNAADFQAVWDAVVLSPELSTVFTETFSEVDATEEVIAEPLEEEAPEDVAEEEEEEEVLEDEDLLASVQNLDRLNQVEKPTRL